MLTSGDAVRLAERLHLRLLNRRPAIARLESYFAGDQALAFASKSWQTVHRGRYDNFADNWCGVVGRAAAERTELLGLRVGEDADVLSPSEAQLMRDWSANDGEAQSAQGFLSGAVTARSFATVWGDSNDEPLLRWEHSAQTIVDYDDMGQPTAALKCWEHDGSEHVTLYTADAVWKWTREAPDEPTERPVWAARLPEVTGDDVWPLPNPLGVVPVVEFPNRPILGTGPVSDIAGVIPMQNAVNLMWAYLFGAADYASMPARVVMGQEPPKMPVLDDKGNVVGEKPVDREALQEGRMLWLTGKETSIGQWDAAKLDVFTGVLHVMVKHLASQTRTPIHYIMGELGNVNGETLTATELPLAFKVREGHKHLTQPLREVFRRFALVRGNQALADECRSARFEWANPETATDAQLADAALKDIQIGLPLETVLARRHRMSPSEIADVMAKREAQAADPYLAGKLGGSVDGAGVAESGGEVSGVAVS